MKNKTFKNQKKGQFPSRPYPEKQPEPEHKPYRIYPEEEPERKAPAKNPETAPWYPIAWTMGTREYIYMDEITVYYSLN